MKNYEINKGEIWEVDNNGSVRVVVILACFERYAATVMLQEQEPGSNAVAVRVRDIMYADAGRLGYVFYDKMVNFVRALSEEGGSSPGNRRTGRRPRIKGRTGSSQKGSRNIQRIVRRYVSQGVRINARHKRRYPSLVEGRA